MATRSASSSLTRALPATVAAAAVLASGVLASAADATTTISRTGNTITLTGDDAADKVFGAGSHSGTYVTFFANPEAALHAGAGCSFLPGRDRGGHRELACGRPARPSNPLTLNATLGGGDDELDLDWRWDRQPRAIVDGGDGNDRISGTILADDLKGGAGNDQIFGMDDVDNIDGGAGDDELFGGPDSDIVVGGLGVDHLYGDAVDTVADPYGTFSGGDIIDATDFPNDLTGVTPEQLIALTPQPDQVACGPGADDTVTDDAADIVAPTCEIRVGANATLPVDHTPQLPYEQVVGPRPRYKLSDLLRGAPLRFSITPSSAAFVDAKLEVSASDARRLHLGNGPSARILGASRPVLLQSKQFGELFLRLDWSDRPHLTHATGLHATLTVRGAVQGATGPTDVVTRRSIVLGR